MRQSRRFTLNNKSEEYIYDSQVSYISIAKSYNSYMGKDWSPGPLSYLTIDSLGHNSVIGYGLDNGSGPYPKAVFIPIELNYNGYLLSGQITVKIRARYYYGTKGPYNYALTTKFKSDYYRDNGTSGTTTNDKRIAEGEIVFGKFYVEHTSGLHDDEVFTFNFTVDKNKKLTENTILYLYLWSSNSSQYNFHATAGRDENNTTFSIIYTCTATKPQ